MGVSRSGTRVVRTTLVVAAVAVAFGLLLVPVDAVYLNRVGSDFTEYRTASCGSPVASLLGADPGLGGGSEHPIGGTSAETACAAASAERAVAALALLLVASLVWGLGRCRRARGSVTVA